MSKMGDMKTEYLTKVVYQLNGSDVMCVLDDMGLLHKMTPQEVEKAIDLVHRRIEIEWMEYIKAALEVHGDLKR